MYASYNVTLYALTKWRIHTGRPYDGEYRVGKGLGRGLMISRGLKKRPKFLASMRGSTMHVKTLTVAVP